MQFIIKGGQVFDHDDNSRWKKKDCVASSRKRGDGCSQERVTCTRVGAFNDLTIRHLFCSADSVVQRDLFQLKSTKIDVFVEHNC